MIFQAAGNPASRPCLVYFKHHISFQLDPAEAYTYISILNTTSAMFSMYGCMQLLTVCRPTLGAFHIRAKLFLLQLVVISTGVLSFVCSLLVKFGAVPCLPPFSIDARGESK